MTQLVLAGNGGIGRALIEALLAQQPNQPIYATYRQERATRLQHPMLTWYRIDLSQEAEVMALARQLPPLTLIVNCAGFLHTQSQRPEKTIAQFESHFFQQNVQANTLPTLWLAKHLGGHLKASQHPCHFVSLSAKIGSIEDNQLGGWISYRCSKAALNMALKTIAIEWRYRIPNCCVVAFHPGTVETPLSQPFQPKNAAPPRQTPAAVSQQLLALLARLSPADSGHFYNYQGQRLPW